MKSCKQFIGDVFTIMVEAPNSVLNVKALEGTFNQEKALVGAFSKIVKTSPKVCCKLYWAWAPLVEYFTTCDLAPCCDITPKF